MIRYAVTWQSPNLHRHPVTANPTINMLNAITPVPAHHQRTAIMPTQKRPQE
jgi:hypothetical protein